MTVNWFPTDFECFTGKCARYAPAAWGLRHFQTIGPDRQACPFPSRFDGQTSKMPMPVLAKSPGGSWWFEVSVGAMTLPEIS